MGNISILEDKKYLLKDIILNIDDLFWGDEVWIELEDINILTSNKINWKESLECFILNEDEIEEYEPDDKDNIYLDNGIVIKCLLGIEDIQGAIDNLKQQCECPSLELMIKAVKHYYEYDGFIEI